MRAGGAAQRQAAEDAQRWGNAHMPGMAPNAGVGNIKAAVNVGTGARHTCMNIQFLLPCMFFFFFSWSEPPYHRLNNNHIHHKSKRTPHPLPTLHHPPIGKAPVFTQQRSSSLCLPANEGAQQSQERCRIPFSLPWRPTTDTAVRRRKKQNKGKKKLAVFFLSLPQLNYSW